MVRIRRLQSPELSGLQRRMEQMMQQLLLGADPAPMARAWVPRVDIYETAEGLALSMEIPGVDREEIEIVVQGQYLRVSGVRQEPSSPGCMRWHQMEIVYGAFERVVALPEAVDPDQIRATYRDGFLRIDIQRGASTPRMVPIDPQ
jgi:HSP20 family protein